MIYIQLYIHLYPFISKNSASCLSKSIVCIYFPTLRKLQQGKFGQMECHRQARKNVEMDVKGGETRKKEMEAISSIFKEEISTGNVTTSDVRNRMKMLQVVLPDIKDNKTYQKRVLDLARKKANATKSGNRYSIIHYYWYYKAGSPLMFLVGLAVGRLLWYFPSSSLHYNYFLQLSGLQFTSKDVTIMHEIVFLVSL